MCVLLPHLLIRVHAARWAVLRVSVSFSPSPSLFSLSFHISLSPPIIIFFLSPFLTLSAAPSQYIVEHDVGGRENNTTKVHIVDSDGRQRHRCKTRYGVSQDLHGREGEEEGESEGKGEGESEGKGEGEGGKECRQPSLTHTYVQCTHVLSFFLSSYSFLPSSSAYLHKPFGHDSVQRERKEHEEDEGPPEESTGAGGKHCQVVPSFDPRKC